MFSSVSYPCLLRYHYKEPQNSTMFSLSSPLQAIKGQLKFNTTTVFLVVFLITLNSTSCEARYFRVHGNKHSSSLPSLPPQDVREVDAAKEKMVRSAMVVARFGSSYDPSMSNEDEVTTMDVKMEAAASSSAGASFDSLRKRFQGIKARSGKRERSVLGADTKSEQHVVSNATTAYTAETLVVMDYLEAHPAPAVHNK